MQLMNPKILVAALCLALANGVSATTLNDGITLGAFGNPNPNTPSPGTLLLAIFDAAPAASSPSAGKTLLVNTLWSYADLVNGVGVNPVDLSASPDFQAIRNDPLVYNVVGAYGLYQNPETGKANLDKNGAELPFDDEVPNNAPWGVIATGHAASDFSADVNDLNNTLANGIQTYWTIVNTELSAVGATENSGPNAVLADVNGPAQWDVNWNGNFAGSGLGLGQDATTVNGSDDIAKLFWITNPSLDSANPNVVTVLGTLQLSASGQLSYSASGANHAPTAHAGSARTVNEGDTVTLDGSLSSDPDAGQTAQLTYQWTAPAGIALNNATAQKPTFTAPLADADRVYTFTLVVTDPVNASSAPVSVAVTVKHLSNHVPTAHAGVAQAVNEGDTVTLDGSASSDPDAGQTAQLAYRWTAPAGITLSSATAQKPTFTAPVSDADRVYTFTLVVTDPGNAPSTPATVAVTVRHVNRAPTAHAGAPRTVSEGATVTLDGSASSDPDTGQSARLTYQWTAPAGITLSDAAAQKPTFTAPVGDADQVYTFTLVVTDSGNAVSTPATVAITVRHVNRAPTAHAGAAQTVNEGDTVTLDGSASSDPDAGQTAGLTYHWTAPDGITLDNPGVVRPSFTAPAALADTSYAFTLVVTDTGSAASAPATVNITVKHRNQAPTADAGSEQTVNVGALVALSGGGSRDPEGEALSHAWSQVSGPASVPLGGADSATASFTATTPGVYVFNLTVTDPRGARAEHTVAVTVVAPANQPPLAAAVAPARVEIGAVVALDGSGSTDPDQGDTLSHAWTPLAGPATTLSSPQATQPIFIAATAGTYAFKLTVTDRAGASSEATVQVTAAPSGPGIAWHDVPATWRVGQAQTLNFAGFGLSGGAKAKLRFAKDGRHFVTLGGVALQKGGFRWKPAKKHITRQGVIQVCVKSDKARRLCDATPIIVEPALN